MMNKLKIILVFISFLWITPASALITSDGQVQHCASEANLALTIADLRDQKVPESTLIQSVLNNKELDRDTKVAVIFNIKQVYSHPEIGPLDYANRVYNICMNAEYNI